MGSENDEDLLSRSLHGDANAMGELLQQYRPYLRILAMRELDPRVSARLSGSDIVQQTCLEAVRDIEQFHGQTVGEFVAWLTQILRHNVSEVTEKHLLAQKRSVRKERSRDDANAPLEIQNPIDQEVSSPSSRSMRGESAIQLAKAMGELPEDQFEAVRLRYIESYSLSDIAQKMNRSESAVGGLLKRGLQGLRTQFSQSEGD